MRNGRPGQHSDKWGGTFALAFDMDSSGHSDYRDNLIWTVELNQFCLELVGIWPKSDILINNRSNFAFNLRTGITLIILIFLSFVPHVCALIRVWGDMMIMVENLQVTVPFLIVSLQLIIMRWKRAAFLSIVNIMAEDWMESKIDAEKDVMIRRARTARLIGICGYIITVSAFIVLLLLPTFGMQFRSISNLTDGKRLLPLQAYYFYDTDKSPQYELTFAVQVISVILASIIYTSVDAFLGFAIFHVCAQLENFRRRLINLVLCKDFNGALRKNVQTHLRLIRFVKDLENIFTLMMLTLVLFFGLLFCLDGFLFVTAFIDENIRNLPLSRICYTVFSIVALLGHTFLYCVAGEIIKVQCEAIYRAMCDLDWYLLETTQAKNLILLMIRANEPLRITAGKVFPLTMATFCNLLKTSAGYVSFLLANRG